jgi:hypothetical protein
MQYYRDDNVLAGQVECYITDKCFSLYKNSLTVDVQYKVMEDKNTPFCEASLNKLVTK